MPQSKRRQALHPNARPLKMGTRFTGDGQVKVFTIKDEQDMVGVWEAGNKAPMGINTAAWSFHEGHLDFVQPPVTDMDGLDRKKMVSEAEYEVS